MTTLHLGVIDIPYSAQFAPAPTVRKGGKPRKVGPGHNRGTTTGDVAEILEDRYHVMEIFFEVHQADIAKALEGSIEGALQNALMGAPAAQDPLAGAHSQIEALFKQFLSNKGLDALGYPGVPTAAALAGVNHRLKLRRGPSRPSFIDTGTFQASFKSWAD